MDYRPIIESKYNRVKWQQLLHDIFFRQEIKFYPQPLQVPVNESMAKQALYTGKITLSDGHTIAIYEVELSDNIVIERNRAGIRNLLCTDWRGKGCSGAFMFCFRHNEAALRFSYVSESFTFAEDGSLKKESTDTKRFTYLLGEGHRSRTAREQFEKLRDSKQTLQDITKAFSVEALSDMFFKEYKKHYEDIIEFITGKRMVKVGNKWEEKVTGQPCHEIMQNFSGFTDSEKAVRDYVKKLMGRLVFIQFLQKKGWMGCPAGEAWNNGDKEFVQNLFSKSKHKDTFIDDVLEPLFHDMNTKRDGDITSSAKVGAGIKIPYLNGGLFEKDDYDKVAFPLPARFLENILDFFASYNFTIDENDPDDAEIGVDPEMLGRIFENLLEDNKDKGAFYTPKEIVHYMCRESLIAYLQSDIKDETLRNSIREFVRQHNASILSDDLKEKIDQKLKDVKICDPAIGSGAFPMGLLRELYACRKAIEGIDDEKAVSIKTHIIQNNIYGVDIEKGAVDIARLRFWLALIVDEKNPHSLPNMDFKIMQGNSLLEQYEGIDISGMSVNELAEQKARKKGQKWQQEFAFDEKGALDNIQHAIKEYYLTDDHDKKTYLRNIINDNVRSYILNIKGFTSDIKQKLEDLPIPNDKFFLWHIYFKEVFDKGGFDIVIANPPYIDSETMVKVMPTLRKLYSNVYSTAKGNWDIFIIFIELGIHLLKRNGILCNIVPNKLIAAKYGVELRNCIATKNVLEIRDYSRIDVFTNAAVYPITILIRNGQPVFDSKFVIMNDILKIRQVNKTVAVNLTGNAYWDVFFMDSPIYNLIAKMNQNIRLEQLPVEIIGSATVADAYEIKKMVKELKEDNNGFKLVNSGTIDPYFTLWGIKPCRYIKGSYAKPIVPFQELQSYSEMRYNQSSSAKIIVASMSTRYEAYLDINGEYIAGKSTTIITGDLKELYFIIGILNSKLASYWLNIVFNSLKMAGGAINVGRNELQMLPIPREHKDFRNIIERIMEQKRNNSSANIFSLETQIDHLVYKLYNLTPEEISIVENATK